MMISNLLKLPYIDCSLLTLTIHLPARYDSVVEGRSIRKIVATIDCIHWLLDFQIVSTHVFP